MACIVPIFGIALLIGLGILLSSNRRAIRPRTVALAFLLQLGIGALVLFVPAGRRVLLAVSDFVTMVLGFSQQGTEFLFGGLVTPRMAELFGGAGFIFAFRVLPVVIFVASLTSVLYYTGVMPLVVRVLGGSLAKLLGTSRTESLSAVANIFVGMTEAPLVIRPFIASMTRSELFAVMVGGLASCSGSTLAGYAAMGIPMQYLIAAGFMAAPAGLLFAKLMEPETETPSGAAEPIGAGQGPANVIEAAANGAADGLKLALNIGAMLLAFVSLIALANAALAACGGLVGVEGLTMQRVLGWIFWPVAFMLGVPGADISTVASLIGEKTILNEFVAFMHLGPLMAGAGAAAMTESAKAIATFALCGFANIGSIAILIGGLGGMAPSRRSEIAALGLRAIAAGTLANLMSGAIAGIFIGLAGAV